MGLKLGVVSEEYITALKQVTKEKSGQDSFRFAKNENNEKSEEKLFSEIEEEFKDRRPRIFYDFNDDFYYSVGIKSDYHGTYHEHYYTVKAVNDMIYHYRYSISRNEKKKHPYLKFDTGVLVPKSAVNIIDYDTIEAIEALTSPYISSTDMYKNNLNYLMKNNEEIEKKIKNYCEHSKEIKKKVNDYWSFLRSHGLTRYVGGFLAKSYLFKIGLDLDFYWKVTERTKNIERQSRSSKMDTKFVDTKHSKDKSASNDYLNLIARVPPCYSFKPSVDTPEGVVRRANPFEHFISSCIRVENACKDGKITQDTIETIRDFGNNVKVVNNSELDYNAVKNQRYILNGEQSIVITNRKTKKNPTIYNLDREEFKNKLIKNTPFISLRSENSKKSSFVYFSVPQSQLHAKINPLDSFETQINKIITAYLVSYNVPYDKTTNTFSNLKASKYSMYDATGNNNSTVKFQLAFFMTICHLNQRTNLNLDFPNCPLLQKHFKQIMENSKLLYDTCVDVSKISSSILNNVKELLNDRIEYDKDTTDRFEKFENNIDFKMHEIEIEDKSKNLGKSEKSTEEQKIDKEKDIKNKETNKKKRYIEREFDYG